MGLFDFMDPIKIQRRELQEFVDGLSGMDATEIGMVICISTAMRNRFSENLRDGIILYPEMLKKQHPLLAFTLSKKTIELQKKGKMIDAAAAMVWVHTIRSCDEPKLRFLGKEMWKHLIRGMPHAHIAKNDLFSLTDFGDLDISNWDQVPVSLNPDN